jgi:hypothetical protein
VALRMARWAAQAPAEQRELRFNEQGMEGDGESVIELPLKCFRRGSAFWRQEPALR